MRETHNRKRLQNPKEAAVPTKGQRPFFIRQKLIKSNIWGRYMAAFLKKIKFFQIIFLKAKWGLSFNCYDDFREQRKGGEHMSADERRQRILEKLCLRRQDTYRNLASEFGVSRETIRHDIVLLMCSYPIETVRGRYGGGVRVKADYLPLRRTLNKKQVKLLVKLSAQLDGDDLATISSIIFQLAP